MAITKIMYMKAGKAGNVAAHLKHSLEYICNEAKTENRSLVGGINCLPDYAYEQMIGTKEMFGQVGGRQGYHFIICGAGKIHCTVDPYGDVKLCPSDEHVLKEEKNNLLEKDMKQIWKDSSVLNWIRGAEFIKCQRCGERCEFSCPLARKERKEEFICSFKQVMH